MRLSSRIQKVIIESCRESFGDARIYLFGSRTDDNLRGGDIDIAVDSKLSYADFRQKKIQFFTHMIRKGFDISIDLVNYTSSDGLLGAEIRRTGILLG